MLFEPLLGTRLYAKPWLGDEKLTKYGSILLKVFSVCKQNRNSKKFRGFYHKAKCHNVTMEAQSATGNQSMNPYFHLKHQEKVRRKDRI